jgi:pimeloyl-ACP methyl ester carboxylesterase
MKTGEHTREHIGRWASPEAERRFRSIEDELWHEAFPAPPSALEVETQVGPTVVYRWPGTGRPVVFLHGMGATSLMWAAFVTAVAGRPACAVDTPGDVGRSRQEAAFRDAAHLAEWLDETLDGLGAGDGAHVVGASYGGWLALNQAVRSPGRLASVSLVEPVGLGEFRMARFMLWGLGTLGAAALPGPLRRRAAVWARMPALADRRMIRMAALGYRRHPFRLPPPVRLEDGELAGIVTPMLVLLGGKSAIHRATAVRDRVHALAPAATVEIVADAGHAMPVSHADLVADRIRAFLDRVEAVPASADGLDDA